MLKAHSDEEPPRPLKIDDAQREKQLTEHVVQLTEWAAQVLIGAEQLGIKAETVDRFPLLGVEGVLLLMTPTIDEKIQRKLAAKNPKFTVGEVGVLLMAVADAMLDAPPSQGFALILTAKSLMDCLELDLPLQGRHARP